MIIIRSALALLLTLTVPRATAAGKAEGADSTRGRPGVSAGMGVSYISARDMVNLVNATPGTTARQGEFSSVVEFFGSATIPFSGPWELKVDYAYMMGSYAVQGLLGQTEYSYMAHMPSALVQYAFVQEGVYNIKAGLGPGFYFGSLTQRDGGSDSEFKGSGPGFLFDLEANTALGEDLFAYLGVLVRWSGIGALTAANGAPPPASPNSETTLQFFGLGARLGLTYYF